MSTALRRACFRTPSTSQFAGHYYERNSLNRLFSTRIGPLEITEEVQEAVQSRKPVVALETTIYTHGFPYPENIALSSRLESIVRQNGGIPATVGILNGVAKVGFQAEELIELLSTAGSPTTVKVSRRDLGLVCGRSINGTKLNGGTTIAGTLVLAHLAGIHVFATGGLGGVHRGGENSLDISADLTELGRTPVALISSGCKSFLDIPRTLEYLETQGVSVSTFADGREGQVDFPAFWTRDSGVPSPVTVKNESEAAAVIDAQLSFPLASGMLFANPIPAESSLEKSRMDEITAEAILEAQRNGATGSDNTPFVLKYIREATKGATITANIALIEANVRRGTLVATELAKLRLRHQNILNRKPGTNQQQRASFSTTAWSRRDLRQPSQQSPSPITNSDRKTSSRIKPGKQVHDRFAHEKIFKREDNSVTVVVVGSVAIDLSCDYKPLSPSPAAARAGKPQQAQDQKPTSTEVLKLATSNPATIRPSVGGVGHNVALALHYLGSSFCFYSAVGNDLEGKSIITALKARGMMTNGIQRYEACQTARYIALNNTDKSLFTAVADMAIFDRIVDDSEFSETWQSLLERHRPKWIVLDANWPSATLGFWMELAKSSKIAAQAVFEPVSIEKSVRAFPGVKSKLLLRRKPAFDLTTPNEYELNAMFDHAASPEYVRAVARVTKRKGGVVNDSAAVEAMVASFRKAADLCLSRAGHHNGPRLGEVQEVAAKAIYLLRYFKTILVKLGSSGILQVTSVFNSDPRLKSADAHSFLLGPKFIQIATSSHLADSVKGIYLRWHPPVASVPPEEIVSVNGVGDTFLGVLVAGLAKTNQSIEELIHVAQLGAIRTLKSKESVSEEIRTLELMTGSTPSINQSKTETKDTPKAATD